MFHWMKGAKQFLTSNSSIISSRPTWLFSSGPIGSKTTDTKGRDLREVSGPNELDELEELSKARDHHVFFGALDTSKQGFFYRMLRQSKAAREAMPAGDFRDWKDVEAWADKITLELEILSR
jgi:menaquinone-dependent protoporphyrinogen oxidase